VHEVIDASGWLVVPGLINAHYHSHDVLCRGLFEELPQEIWLLYTLPMGGDRSKDEVRARTLVGALECLRCGITTVQDMLGLSPLTDEQTDVVIGYVLLSSRPMARTTRRNFNVRRAISLPPSRLPARAPS
jgi:5-methylthioadenosine/S-adenosylhomocysteine deaminase